MDDASFSIGVPKCQALPRLLFDRADENAVILGLDDITLVLRVNRVIGVQDRRD